MTTMMKLREGTLLSMNKIQAKWTTKNIWTEGGLEMTLTNLKRERRMMTLVILMTVSKSLQRVKEYRHLRFPKRLLYPPSLPL